MKSIVSLYLFPFFKKINILTVVNTSMALVILVSGCAGPGSVNKSTQEIDTPAEQTVWPAPPEQPRIRFLRSLKFVEDITGEKNQNLRDRLLGKEQENDLLFKKPLGVHSDSSGRLYVADTGVMGLHVIDLKKKRVFSWGETGPGILNKAVAVTTDGEGNVYVSDNIDKRIVMFDRDGKFVKAFGGKGVLGSPGGLVFDDNSQQLYVVDVKNHHVKVFDKSGNIAFTIGERGHKKGQFNYPTNLAMDGKSQNLYVADTMNFRVQIFTPDGSFVSTFGRNGNGPGNFTRLKGIGVDTDGHIYAVDASFNNVQILDQQGQLLLFVGHSGVGPDGFYLPAGAHVDKNNHIFIADQYNQRIQMFEYIEENKI